MSKMTIIEGNSNDKDNVRAYMVKGERGDDGVSPTFETSKSGDTATITITDVEGTHEVELIDGVSPTIDVSKTGKTTTLTITDAEGTETTTINDGVDLTGGVPTNGVIGFDGTVNDIPNGYEVTSSIMESGTNSNGSYIKFYDGTMICQKTVDLSGNSATTSIGDLFRSDSLSLGNWAEAFTTTPFSIAQQTGGTTLIWVGFRDGISSTSAGNVMLIRATTLANISCEVTAIAIGRWK